MARARWHRTIVILLLSIHAVLLAWIGWHTSPNHTEVGHMGAGVGTWQRFRFDAYRVNPPLVRTIATAPVVFSFPQDELTSYSSWPHDRCEWALGIEFLSKHTSEEIQSSFALARFVIIPFSLLGGFLCFRLSTELYGNTAGLCALVLWCFSPTLLGWGATICPDVAAAALGLGATYALLQWLQVPNWERALLVGLALGIAELTKFTLLIFYPLFPTLWLLYRWPEARKIEKKRWIRELFHLSVILILSVLVINAGYSFEGSFRQLDDYQFQSAMFAGDDTVDDISQERANRFAGKWLGKLVVPLPANFVQGIDTQRYDFEHGMPSYLRGEWADDGWWYYYLYLLAIKVPLGSWCLAALALAVTILARSYSASRRDEMTVLSPFVVIVVFISSQTGFSLHPRYIIPALPYLFVWMSKVAWVFELQAFTLLLRRVVVTMGAMALTWLVGSSLIIYPHSLSYFNELTAVLPTPIDSLYRKSVNRRDENDSILSRMKQLLISGPYHGPCHLLGSNIDWGQDLLYLSDWLKSRPDITLDGLAYSGLYPATLMGIPETRAPAPSREGESHNSASPESSLGPMPGWYAMSVNSIYDRNGQYRYFLHFQPVAMAGYSIYIYHITLDKANQVRKELGLVELSGD